MRLDYQNEICVRILVALSVLDQRLRLSDFAVMFGGKRYHYVTAQGILLKNGLIQTFRGPTGGIELNRPATSLTLADVFWAVQSEKLLPAVKDKPFNTVLNLQLSPKYDKALTVFADELRHTSIAHLSMGEDVRASIKKAAIDHGIISST